MRGADPSDDRRWVEACLAGDAEAFSQLLSRYETMVYNLVLRIVHQREEAQDITQEAFLNAYTHLADYDPQRPFVAWILGIARNQALYRLRGLKRREVASDTIEEQGTPAADCDTARRAELKELEREVLRCLDSLPEKYRTVLVLRHMLERTYQEISDALSMNLGTVKTNIHLGRKQLREQLERLSLVDPGR